MEILGNVHPKIIVYVNTNVLVVNFKTKYHKRHAKRVPLERTVLLVNPVVHCVPLVVPKERTQVELQQFVIFAVLENTMI